MPPAARLTDMHLCPMQTPALVPVPHVGGPIAFLGEPTVLIGFLPAARITDKCICVGPLDPIIQGSINVLIGRKPAARMFDKCAHGGMIIQGQLNVLIGTTAGTVTVPISAVTPVPGAPSVQSYATQEAAAVAALNEANSPSIAQNREFGGLIYQNPDGTYGYTEPSPGDGASFDPTTVSAPPGATVVGDYHTHADYSTEGPNGEPQRTTDPSQDAYNSDNFSQDDRDGITNDAAGNPDYRGYLGTPSGQFREYDPNTGTTRNIP
jgi:uncharacterized Zn-binding protein involved in type VI secretion